MNDFGIYIIITEPVLPYREIARICVEEGIKLLQLREKKLSDREIIRIGSEILQVTRGTDTKLLINDRPDIAALIGADGYHLGQDDLPFELAKNIYPEASIRGISTHNLSQVQEAVLQQPDYIGFGPVYPTPTKEKPDPVVGTGLLKEVLSLVNIPVVAIGGINEENIAQVLQAGAGNIALVRYFMQHRDLRERIRTIKSICKQYWR